MEGGRAAQSEGERVEGSFASGLLLAYNNTTQKMEGRGVSGCPRCYSLPVSDVDAVSASLLTSQEWTVR